MKEEEEEEEEEEEDEDKEDATHLSREYTYRCNT